MEKPRILQVSTADRAGGAERVAYDLHRQYLAQGLDATLAVGFKTLPDAPDDHVIEIPNNRYRRPFARAMNALAPRVTTAARYSFARDVRRAMIAAGEPTRAKRKAAGYDDFDFPATAELLHLTHPAPDILHLHNLHGGYFDLRALPQLTHSTPTVLTAHDAWPAGGHCAHPLDCHQWKLGCEKCPHLDSPPAVSHDNTAANWRAKRDIFANCRLHLVGPATWVTDLLQQSILAPAIVSTTVIANGVDQTVFRPGPRAAARAELGLPQNARIVSFASTGRANPYKDYATLETATRILSEQYAREHDVSADVESGDAASTGNVRPLVFVLLGAADRTTGTGRNRLASGRTPPPSANGVSVLNTPFITDPQVMARYYQASDLYLHASRAEVLPLALLEAQSCGVPVVATDVGGVAEAVDAGNTAILVPPENPQALAAAVHTLLADEPRLRAMGERATAFARPRFSLQTMTENYLAHYQRIGVCD
ncbi:MAG: glycosyltransferase [Actinomycetes bacterium]|jgi:glycosyltransferase involved in cell wall biosynthesis|nr:glycosyltransferase [Actinomycetes bacterium]